MSLRSFWLACSAAALVSVSAFATSDGVNSYKGWRSEAAQKARTAPVGQVYIEGDEIPNAAPVLAVVSGPRSGDQIYNASCMGCHATGAAGAPIRGDKAAWAARIKKGDAALLNSLNSGFNAMPAKGMCMDCSEAELKMVLGFMLETVK